MPPKEFYRNSLVVALKDLVSFVVTNCVLAPNAAAPLLPLDSIVLKRVEAYCSFYSTLASDLFGEDPVLNSRFLMYQWLPYYNAAAIAFSQGMNGQGAMAYLVKAEAAIRCHVSKEATRTDELKTLSTLYTPLSLLSVSHSHQVLQLRSPTC